MTGIFDTEGRRPLISIVTVCFQAAATIEETLASVAAQEFTDFEHLIVDGGSSDATMDIVRRHGNPRMRISSEPDRGIYDAMNKGIARATGSWLLMLNADDTLLDPGSLGRMAQAVRHAQAAAAIHYFDYMLLHGDREIPVIAPATVDFRHGMALCHQAMLFHREVFAQAGVFDLGFRLAADFEHAVRCQDRGVAFIRHSGAVVRFRTGGSSHQGRRSLDEAKRIIHRRYGRWWSVRYHGMHLLWKARLGLITLLGPRWTAFAKRILRPRQAARG